MRKQTHAMIAVLRYTFLWLKCFSEWRGHKKIDACYDRGIKCIPFFG